MRVVSVRYKPNSKVYRLANQKLLKTHRYCCLGPGDDIVIIGAHTAHARCLNGHAQILPLYAGRDELVIGTRTLRLTIKEIETEEELAAISGYLGSWVSVVSGVICGIWGHIWGQAMIISGVRQ